MRKVNLYSTARRPPARVEAAADGSPVVPAGGAEPGAAPAARRDAGLRSWLRALASRRVAWGAVGLLGVLVLVQATRPAPPRRLAQDDIDQAVLHTLATRSLPSRTARAYERIRRSVVRVRGLAEGRGGRAGAEEGIGTGVVIVDRGIILTNLHVVAGASRVEVTFADGLETPASVIGVRPEQDLAVLQARTVPDDLVPATLRSTEDLAPGDEVLAVGFPFGIGPSASAGVISGLGRSFRSPRGQRVLTDLIQFDAAANPGNSGGPLVTMDGEVVGIVTAIFNPTEQRVFVGIGFAVPIESAASAVGLSPF